MFFNSAEKNFNIMMSVTGRIDNIRDALNGRSLGCPELDEYDRSKLESALSCLESASDSQDYKLMKQALKDTDDIVDRFCLWV